MASEKKGQARIGADPEICVVDKKGLCIPAWKFTTGTKEVPTAVGGVMMHADNVALELLVKPATGWDSFYQSCNVSMTAARLAVSEGMKGCDIRTVPFIRSFEAGALLHPMARAFGCNPDFSAYEEEGVARVPINAEKYPDVRFFGGHIHIGYRPRITVPAAVFARFMDLVVGLPSISLDVQGERRPVYGLAGLYRPKDYGIEYRTLSNFWFGHEGRTAVIGRNVFTLIAVIEQYRDFAINMFESMNWERVKDLIDSESRAEAAQLFGTVAEQVRHHAGYRLEAFYE